MNRLSLLTLILLILSTAGCLWALQWYPDSGDSYRVMQLEYGETGWHLEGNETHRNLYDGIATIAAALSHTPTPTYTSFDTNTPTDTPTPSPTPTDTPTCGPYLSAYDETLTDRCQRTADGNVTFRKAVEVLGVDIDGTILDVQDGSGNSVLITNDEQEIGLWNTVAGSGRWLAAKKAGSATRLILADLNFQAGHPNSDNLTALRVSNKNDGGYIVGVHGYVDNAGGNTRAVYGSTQGTDNSGTHVGVYGYSYGSNSGVNFGVWGQAQNGGTNVGAYFDPHVWIAGDLYLDRDGDDSNQYIYFYEDGSATGEYLKWNNDDWFEFSDQVRIDENMTDMCIYARNTGSGYSLNTYTYNNSVILARQASDASGNEDFPSTSPTLVLRRDSGTDAKGASIYLGNNDGGFYVFGRESALEFYHSSDTTDEVLQLSAAQILCSVDLDPNGEKYYDSGDATNCWDDVYADDFQNVTDCPSSWGCYEDVLAEVKRIKPREYILEDGSRVQHLDYVSLPKTCRTKTKKRDAEGNWKGAYWKDDAVVSAFDKLNGNTGQWIGEYEKSADGNYVYQDNVYSVTAVQVFNVQAIQALVEKVEALEAELAAMREK